MNFLVTYRNGTSFIIAHREKPLVLGMEGRRHVGWNRMGPPIIVTLFVFKIAESFVKE